MATAYLLVAHGSRDPRPQRALAQLAERLAVRLDCAVDWAMLEFAPVPLGDRIVEFAAEHPNDRIVLAPFFLSSGVHVCEDIPEQLALARAQWSDKLGSAVPLIEVFPPAGATIDFARAICDRLAAVDGHLPIDAWVTIAHGSNRPGGNTEVEQIADRVRTVLPVPHYLAYRSREGDIDATLARCVADGHRRVGILPHFLFPGRLTDAIADRVAHPDPAHPEVSTLLLPTWSEDLDWAVQAMATWLQVGDSDRSFSLETATCAN